MKLSTDPYKGVRDFYPEDEAAQKYIYKIWRETVEKFGYVQYDASILEPTELYKAKSGEEIVNEQTYSFTDRGEREVTLRPEMTPTVARMVAGRRQDLSFPLRWYSIPNLFRYERPQKGRLREHFQLNCDMFGVDNLNAEVEMVQLAYDIMKSFGATDTDFSIRLGSRKILDKVFADARLDAEQAHKMQKLLDRKKKIENFEEQAATILGKPFDLKFEPDEEVRHVIDTLNKLGISNVEYDASITRGFDYYTGIVFEVFDTDPENNRSMFGGGRYDDLLSLFGGDKVPAVGFGMGDVTIHDFLESRNLLPSYVSPTHLYMCNAGVDAGELFVIADSLRAQGISVAVDLSGKKIGDQIKKAVKDKVSFAVVIGSDELNSKRIKIKHLASEKEEEIELDSVASYIASL